MTPSLTEFWSERSAAAKAVLALLALATVALAVWAGAWVLRDDYLPLFGDLDTRDAAAIAAELERMKVPYRVEDGGRSLLVEQGAVHRTRLKVMGNGVDLKGTVGFEIFNNTDFGMTEFAQKINYQRALQGELARTIGALEEIRSARVHLVLPESGLFKRGAVRPKASVALAVHGERRLTAAQIHGIQRLVAASVPEMNPAAVTVLDHQGVALSRRADAGSEGGEAADARLDAKKDVEAHLTRKVAAILDRALGPGQAIVSVDVTLRHDHIKTTREEVVQPRGARGGAVVRRRDTVQRAGAAAAAADAPRPTARAAGTSTSDIEYLHGRTVEQVVSAPGSVRRVSVGVLLPANVPQQQAEGLKQVIAMAVGLDAGRGDAIAITRAGTAPATPPAPAAALALRPAVALRLPAAPAPSLSSAVPEAAWPALAGVLALAAALLLLLARRRGARVAGVVALTAAQREQMLGRVRAWITDGPAGAGREA